MSEDHFSDEITLSETVEKLGKRAMKLGLIPGFVVHFFPDSSQFYIPNEKECDPLTPEEAYFRLNKLVKQAGK